MHRTCCVVLILFACTELKAQPVFQGDSVSVDEVRYTMELLAGDSLQGRGNFQPGLLKAAKFIGGRFKSMGLRPLPGYMGYYIPFRPAGGKKNETGDRLVINGREQPSSAFIYYNDLPGLYPDKDLSSFTVKEVPELSDDLLVSLGTDTTDLLLWCRKRLPKKTKLRELSFIIPAGGVKRNILLLVSDSIPVTLALRGNPAFYASLEYNVVATLEGRSPETLLLSAHYDHEGIIPGQTGDSIMNGANDNASGTTAMLALARQLSERHDNTRTIIFAAFAAEELGMIGSLHFASTARLDNIIAVVNLEMLGLPQFGKRTVFITGQFDSDLPKVLGRELEANSLTVKPDPVPDRKLYERSDNYPFALKDIPAHTIMGGTDDDECYHQFCDETGRLDMDNLTAIINSIKGALEKFVNGDIKKKDLN